MNRSSVTVVTPATSANLGPGFDSLGLALEFHDRMTAEVIDSGLEFDISGACADEVPQDESHLVYRAMDAVFTILGQRPSGLRLTCQNVIPHGRGLGSSSAAIVAGIVAAHELVGGGLLDDVTMLQMATDLEGHPDNVAPALFGGFTIAWIEGGAARCHRMDVSTDLTVFIPPAAVATKAARELLPDSVPHADAAFNAARSALIVAGLTGAPELLLSATEDRIHQGYRSAAMPESYHLVRSLRAEGIPAVISGAGPTVLAFGAGLTDATPEGWAHRETGVDTPGVRVL